MEQIVNIIETQGMKLLGGLVVLAVGLFLAHWIMKFLTRNQKLVNIEPTLKGFLLNFLKLIMYITVVLTAASVMGIPLTSFLTIIASAGVAASLAMQGALSNFVGGLTLLLLKPFKVGEYVVIGSTEGIVRHIGLFYTELITPDNRNICLPNNNLTGTAIVNNTREGTRRLDVAFSAAYAADTEQVKQLLLDVAAANPRVLTAPAPVARLTECGDSALTFTLRVWCRCEHCWDVNCDLLESGKRALDEANIEIPFPQLDVHMR